MTEGELKKRIVKADYGYWATGEAVDTEWMRRFPDAVSKQPVFRWLEECAHEFPSFKPVIIPETGVSQREYNSMVQKHAAEYILETQKWFKKWFGEQTT